MRDGIFGILRSEIMKQKNPTSISESRTKINIAGFQLKTC